LVNDCPVVKIGINGANCGEIHESEPLHKMDCLEV
jgi:hypothetical protein